MVFVLRKSRGFAKRVLARVRRDLYKFTLFFLSVLSETASVKNALNTFIQNDSPGAPVIDDRSILMALFIRFSSESNPLALTGLRKALRIMAAYEALPPHLAKLSLASRHEILAQAAAGDDRIEREIFDEVLSGSTVQNFANGTFTFPDKNSAWVLTNEIFVGEDYFFESSREDPLVIDAGVHAGFAVLYIKALYPKARIIGFEPDPRMYDLAKDNISALQLTQVELLPYALSDEDGFVTYYVAEKDSMASSLRERPRPNEMYKPRSVEARKLSHWLNEPVEFLKMDIEGAESEVIRECGEKLRNVHHLFVEFHQGHGLAQERLAEILLELNKHEFAVNVGKSWGHALQTSHKPLRHVTGPYSGVIWATNLNW